MSPDTQPPAALPQPKAPQPNSIWRTHHTGQHHHHHHPPPTEVCLAACPAVLAHMLLMLFNAAKRHKCRQETQKTHTEAQGQNPSASASPSHPVQHAVHLLHSCPPSAHLPTPNCPAPLCLSVHSLYNHQTVGLTQVNLQSTDSTNCTRSSSKAAACRRCPTAHTEQSKYSPSAAALLPIHSALVTHTQPSTAEESGDPGAPGRQH